MPKQAEENLDDVIADLVDESPATTENESSSSPFEGIDTSQNTIDGPPVQLTDRAARQVDKIMEKEDFEEELYLRVAVEGGGCSGLSYKLGLDHKTDEDELIEHNGIKIVVDSKHMMYLEGITIDYPDGLDARGFTFDNPNATETCGCGSSFAT
ncbi:MAG TPA: iron-sulfur cluster assembly accessory protein [Balneolaceae bacterium]|nr:iron-sulfur cluster assembly accessory protein [Balneolaceae bacterium]